MMRHASTWLAWLVLLVCVATIGAGAAIHGSSPDNMPGSWADVISFLAFPIVGALIIARRPGNTVGWILCAIGLGTATTSFTAGYVQHALAMHTDTHLATGIIDAAGNVIWPVNIGLGVLLIFLFPDGRLVSHAWRPVFWLAVVAIAAQAIAGGLMPGPLEPNGKVLNPFGLASAGPILAGVNVVGHILLIPLILAGVASLIVRYLRADEMQRQRIKWFVYGVAMLVLIIVASIVLSDALTPSGQDSTNSVISNIGFALAFIMLPLGVGIGVLRYRLYDIDILINRTLVYASLTAVLAAVYFACVLGAQAITERLTEQTKPQPVVVVASTLLIAALFTPLRRRLQADIDRRFYRQKYDAAKTLAAFSASLRNEVNLAELRQHIVAVVEETMQPEHATLWLSPNAPAQAQPTGISDRQSGVKQSDGGMA